MEELLTKIGELVSTEMEEVKDVKYVDKQMWYMFYIVLNDNRKVLLSLIESTNNEWILECGTRNAKHTGDQLHLAAVETNGLVRDESSALIGSPTCGSCSVFEWAE